MDSLKLLHFLTFISLGVVAAKHADLEVYWKSKLPTSPMPKPITELIHNGNFKGGSNFNVRPDISFRIYRNYRFCRPSCNHRTNNDNQLHDDHKNILAFFLEKDLHGGSSMKMQFLESTKDTTAFLPRKVADSTPFSSKSVPEILKKFAVNPRSPQAEAIRQTIADCEKPAVEGEDKYCATSLESMVDFSTSKLGKNVLAFSNESPKTDGRIQVYRILDVSQLNIKNDKAIEEFVICHKQNYIYVVFYCHSLQKTDAYMADLVGRDGAKVKAVVVCHKDTSEWDPKYPAFQVLKVKPGIPICHFLPGDHVVWVPKH